MLGSHARFAAPQLMLLAFFTIGCFPNYPTGSSKYTNNLLVDRCCLEAADK